MALRSNFGANNARTVIRRAQWVSLGINPEDMERPKVALVNTSNDLAACFAHLDEIVNVLKTRAYETGLLPFEIRTAAPSDFVTSAGKGGRYILPSRDLITNDIEVMVEGAQLDAMICLSSCDKTTPGHLMAAGRLNIPTIIIPCGYQRSGLAEGGDSDVEEVFFKSAVQAMDGKIEDDVLRQADDAIRSPGVCSGLATANSMHMVAEALGMTVPHAAPVQANSEHMWDVVDRSVDAIAVAVEKNLTPRRIMTNASVNTAVRTMLSVGGSNNTIKHLQAVAVETGLDIDVWETYRKLGRETPTLCSIRPNGDHLVEDLEASGGAATVLKELLPLIGGDQLTITGKTLVENLETAKPADGKVVRPLDAPLSTSPAIVVVKGSLVPEGAVVKRPIPDPGPFEFTGPAKIFHSREEGIEAVSRGDIQPGDVAVIRGLGVTGGPAMGMVSAFIFALNGRGLSEKVAVISDGQLSGLVNRGIVVGEASPEAAADGPLGRMQNGDQVHIDLITGTVDLLVDEEVLAARPPYQAPPATEDFSGLLDQYRATVQPLACGAVLCGNGPCSAPKA
ncbi:dihydroxy-acid dehydratase domain-containing protein [Nesterenkonia haasae]|uniref:dihydroxy-acid dehydratase domain-containing protein n=1 Tax=Nesterenkonia haasae TaxID=2587813 RepID=UPI001391BC41|nr:dihydroxy-acid dehydratase [Nesterenkonia haasae]NDK32582.1 dihydroxy-acid dehydratase [Nesterenkonia haasae]